MNYELAIDRYWFKRKPTKHRNRKQCAWCGTRLTWVRGGEHSLRTAVKNGIETAVCGSICKSKFEENK
jgi:hypothetical protein